MHAVLLPYISDVLCFDIYMHRGSVVIATCVDFQITRWRFDSGPSVARPLSVLSQQQVQLASEGLCMGVQALLSEQQNNPKLSDEDITLD